jgi:pyridoxal phosphate enzyme (YggS family)
MTEAATATLHTRAEAVRGRIRAAAERAGRDPASITLIAVSKTHPASAVRAAMADGLRDFGENRVQEGIAKAAEFGAAESPTWHLIGHLQTNKVRAALETFAILHAVDSERLLRAISAAASRPIQVFIEVNVAGEATKFGVRPEDVAALVAVGGRLPNIEVAGLMTVAPRTADPEEIRPVFRTLRGLASANGLPALSMGMTDDFEVAIAEGATHIRVGRAIFGERQ